MTIKNNSAYFHFEILEKFTAGIILLGTELKSIRKSKVSFNDTFCIVHNNEVFVRNLHIAPYELGTDANHNPLRERKLLLHQKEIRSIEKKIKERGFTIIPLSLFMNNKGFVKMDIAIARGKKEYDKRESLKKKDAQREIKKLLP